MKARVIITGNVIEVKSKVMTSSVTGKNILKYVDQKTGISYFEEELFFPKDLADDPDYWTRLEHQAAIAAMQGLCANPQYPDKSWDEMATDAAIAAHALVEKYKEKEK